MLCSNKHLFFKAYFRGLFECMRVTEKIHFESASVCWKMHVAATQAFENLINCC